MLRKSLFPGIFNLNLMLSFEKFKNINQNDKKIEEMSSFIIFYFYYVNKEIKTNITF